MMNMIISIFNITMTIITRVVLNFEIFEFCI